MNERSSTKRVNGRAERSPCERVDLKLPVVASSEARRPSGSGFKSRRLARVDRVRGSERTGRVHFLPVASLPPVSGLLSDAHSDQDLYSPEILSSNGISREDHVPPFHPP